MPNTLHTNMLASPSLLARLWGSGCSLVKWGLGVLAALAIGVAAFCYLRVDEEIRASAESLLAEHYPRLTVSVHSAVIHTGEAIVLRGIHLAETHSDGPLPGLLDAEELSLVCNASWESLLRGDAEIRQMVLRGPKLQCTRRPDGSLSVAQLFPLPELGSEAVTLIVERGTIEYSDPRSVPMLSWSIRNVNLEVVPLDAQPGLPLAETTFMVRGEGTSENIQHIQFEAKVYGLAGHVEFKALSEDVELSQEFFSLVCQAVGVELPEFVRDCTMQGQAKLQLHLMHNPAKVSPVEYAITSEISRGRLQHEDWPRPLTDLKGTLVVGTGGWSVDHLTALWGAATLEANLSGNGFTPNESWQGAVVANRLRLDSHLSRAMPPALAAGWNALQPGGEIDLRVNLTEYGKRGLPVVDVTCRDVEFAHASFPRRLERTTGHIHWEDNWLTSNNLSAHLGADELQLEFSARTDSPDFVGQARLHGSHIKLDRPLVAAAPKTLRSVLEALHLGGEASLDVTITGKPAGGPEPATVSAAGFVQFHRCQILYDRFAYPISNVRGVLELTPGRWVFKDFEGSHGAGRITCSGLLQKGPQGFEGGLDIRGEGIALDDDLGHALGPNAGLVWNSLQPRGRADIDCQIVFPVGQPGRCQWIKVSPLESETSVQLLGTALRMDRLSGQFVYQGNRVTARQVSMRSGPIRVSTSLDGQITPSGGWTATLKDLLATGIRPDPSLMSMLPASVQKACQQIQLDGNFQVQGELQFASTGEPQSPVTANWHGRVNIHHGAADVGARISAITGSLGAHGSFDGRAWHNSGELDIASLQCGDFHCFQLSGPYYVDSKRLVLGQPSQTDAGMRIPRELTGQIFDGQLSAMGQVLWGAGEESPDARFQLRAALRNADVANVACELLPGENEITGKVDATVTLEGTSAGAHTQQGRGSIRLHDADIYELQALARLLKLFNQARPDKTAFTDSDIDFRIDGNYVYFNRINLIGDAVSLLGMGQMDREGNMELEFTGRIGRYEPPIPLIGMITGETSRQTLSIQLSGTWDDPEIKKIPLPALSHALQSLQKEKQGPGTLGSGMRTEARRPARDTTRR